MQSEHSFITKDQNMVKYLIHLPTGMKDSGTKKWPLILFLHGGGERGNQLSLVKQHGVAKIAEQQANFPFITVSPQCPIHSYWPLEVEALNDLLNHITKQHPVDINRIYLTGLSMGAIGGWHLALLYPEKFAAFAPICGSLTIPEIRREEFELSGSFDEFYQKLSSIKSLPIWAFHGDKDPIIPIKETKEIIQRLKSIGGTPKFTIYKDAGHDVWTKTYNNPELYDWFITHRKYNS